MNAEEIRQHIDRLIKSQGKKYRQLSLAMGKNEAYLHQYINKHSPARLPEEQRRILAQMLEVDEQQLTDISLPESQSTIFGSENISLDILSAQSGQKTGIWSVSDEQYHRFTFANPQNIKMLSVRGDLMSPTLQDGDFVLADTSQRTLTTDGLFWVNIRGNLCIRRLQQTEPDAVSIISDNMRYATVVANKDEIQIAGKIIWIFKSERVG